MTIAQRIRRDVGAGMALALLLSFFVDGAIMIVPIYDMQLYDRVIQSHNLDTLAALAIACTIGVVLYGLTDYLRSALLIVLGDRIARRLHGPVLAAAVGRGAGGDVGAGVAAIRDLDELRGFLCSGAVATPLDAIVAPVMLAVLYLLHPAYFYLGVIAIVVLVLFGLAVESVGRPGLVAATAARGRVSNRLAARLRERELSEGMGMLPAIAARWQAEQAAALAALRHATARADLITGALRIVRLLLQAGVMTLGAIMILGHATTPGSLMGANLLINKMISPFDHLVESWRHWSLAAAAWRRLRSLLADAGQSRATPMAVPGEAGLVLDEVGATHDGRTLLERISLAVPPGATLGVVGANGAGKSTLLRLLSGLAEPCGGAIRLDGLPLAALDRTRIGYLPQGIHLLDGSIADNVMRFAPPGPEATARVVAAARRADVHELIGRLRLGYDAELADTARLSGGQRQRVGLARALFDAPRLLLLDEPDASLDHEGDAALLRAIAAAAAAGAVVVVVTHRAALLNTMRYRLTLAAGRLVSLVDQGAEIEAA